MRRFLFVGPDACRSSLLTLMGGEFKLAEICKSTTLDDGFSCIREDRLFDLVLVDVDPFFIQAIETLRGICSRCAGMRFVVITNFVSRECIFASLAGGLLHGFISKRQSDEEVVAAIKDVLLGRTYVPWPLVEGNGAQDIIAPNPLDGIERRLKLTPRQHQVLRLLSLGMSNKEIARELYIAESTAKIHTSMLMRALGVRNRTEAAFKAGRLLGLIEEPQSDPIAMAGLQTSIPSKPRQSRLRATIG